MWSPSTECVWSSYLLDFSPSLPGPGVRGLLPRGTGGPLVLHGGQRVHGPPTWPQTLPQELLLILQDLLLDLVGSFLQRVLGFRQGVFVVFADLGQDLLVVGGTGAADGPGPSVGLHRGRVEEHPAEQLGGVGQEEDGPEAQRDEGAEHQQQDEPLRQPEGGGRPGGLPARRGSERQQGGGGHRPVSPAPNHRLSRFKAPVRFRRTRGRLSASFTRVLVHIQDSDEG